MNSVHPGQALNDVTGELLAVKLCHNSDGCVKGGLMGNSGPEVEALLTCLATRHPNLVRYGDNIQGLEAMPRYRSQLLHSD